jgi:diketogulonate reductase-like aldo/keto reductase
MKYETSHNLSLPKLGFGTARVGGALLPNRSRDQYYLSALRSALELGYTHFDTAELYSLGHSEELIGRAIHEAGVKRESLFITTKVWPAHLSYKNVLRACENSLRRLGTEYIDLYLIHWPNPFISLKDTFRAFNQLVREGKVKHIGVSNFNLNLLKQSQALSESPITTDQVPYSLFHRSYVKNGVLEYCQQNDILLTAYTPVGRGNIHADKTLRSIASAHQATPHQIALTWLVAQARVITIPMSFNPRHQKENLDAVDIELSTAEMEQLDHIG